MAEKFGLEFTLLSREAVARSCGNAVEEVDLLAGRWPVYDAGPTVRKAQHQLILAHSND